MASKDRKEGQKHKESREKSMTTRKYIKLYNFFSHKNDFSSKNPFFLSIRSSLRLIFLLSFLFSFWFFFFIVKQISFDKNLVNLEWDSLEINKKIEIDIDLIQLLWIRKMLLWYVNYDIKWTTKTFYPKHKSYQLVYIYNNVYALVIR